MKLIVHKILRSAALGRKVPSCCCYCCYHQSALRTYVDLEAETEIHIVRILPVSLSIRFATTETSTLFNNHPGTAIVAYLVRTSSI